MLFERDFTWRFVSDHVENGSQPVRAKVEKCDERNLRAPKVVYVVPHVLVDPVVIDRFVPAAGAGLMGRIETSSYSSSD